MNVSNPQNSTLQISVIMSVYNSEKFIGPAIESILNQSFKDFELIIVDDGSTDNSVNEIEKYIDDTRIKLYKNDHVGLVRQLNFALAKAKGIYIARMDADDISIHSRFEIQLEFLQKNKDIVLVGSNIRHIDDIGKIIKLIEYPESHYNIEHQMPVFSSFCHPTILSYTSIIKKLGGYNNKYESAEDHALFLEMLEKGYKMYNIQKYLLNYRIHTDSVTSLNNQKQNMISYNIGHEYLRKKEVKAKDNQDLYKIKFRQGLIEYYRGDMSVARKYFVKCISLFPQNIFFILRYILISYLGTRLINKLRTKMFLYRFNLFIYKFFGIDLHKIKNLK